MLLTVDHVQLFGQQRIRARWEAQLEICAQQESLTLCCPAGEAAKRTRPNEEQTGPDKKPEAQSTPALPAFLRPSSIQAVYGEGPKANGTECALTEK